MTGSEAEEATLTTADLVGAAQRVAGVLAAKDRGDARGVEALMDSFPSDRALAGGAMLLAQLLLGMQAAQAEVSLEEVVVRLNADLERIVWN